MGVAMSVNNLTMTVFEWMQNMIVGRPTLAPTPTPAQLTTPPRVAPVAFVQVTVSSIACSISSTLVMSVLMYFTRSLVNGGSDKSRTAMHADESRSSCAVARPRPDDLRRWMK